MYGSIEFGGTKIKCASFDENGKVIDDCWIDTKNPEDNLEKIGDFYKKNPVEALGVGAFGPIDLNEESKTYGYIQNTPKKLWVNYDLLGNLKKQVCQKIKIVTDVGLSLIGEANKGAGEKLNSSLYLTIGTGIGGAYIQNGKLLNGFSHPEMGHINIKRMKDDDFKSTCTYHEDCLEGLACGPSVNKRLGQNPKDADINEKAFKIAANYIAQAIYTYTLVLRPEIVIIGGGLINKEGFIEMIREDFDKIKGDYIPVKESCEYIVKPKLKNDSALIGGYLLAKSL
ncbi:ROK family protein [Anaerococcus hydrogenalis]|uniref:fructokinase n=1 Tax=Anaerococcus hydrogenalis TaxID=33029 RepID=A0A2N6UIX5_9FIRM|nr:ROK family protein [Anaerococcus hydrogenalis]MDK7694981.1 ROK family protein [Anaerococcus hydrogenalis]MDK7696465.1 ROK family protein [Anaerococcus hydrogenalis]MDK7708008.1 ROK family protein [Anaerococcus hydrogenalis]PMC81611.1 fructokinase [Anaerococcus hydrogenalis]